MQVPPLNCGWPCYPAQLTGTRSTESAIDGMMLMLTICCVLSFTILNSSKTGGTDVCKRTDVYTKTAKNVSSLESRK